MPVDIAILAATLVNQVLVPFFKKSGENVEDKLSESVSDGAAKFATSMASKLWSRITSRFTSDRDHFLTTSFSDDPDAASALLIKQLVEKMREDPEFRDELAQLASAKDPDGAGDVVQIFNSGNFVDARQAHVEHGFIAASVGTVNPSPATGQTHAPPPPSVEQS